ncbi:hypothetical protein [Flavobacterium sp. N1994]|uniref:hypothetical protein n=1 Tax=Flavobacterium sp. N1994 TaxID=2986827 RepID=UPI002223CBE0|nr:hypothetical protein [Flavobacterium sp. N1994]
MKKILLILIVITLLFPKQARAQNNTATAIAATVATAGLITAAILSSEDMKERAELRATQWVLANHPEFTTFNLETFDFNGKKAKDMSTTTVISFKIQEFTPVMNPKLDGKKYVLFCFTSYGWISDQGMDFSKVNWYLIDGEEWLKMMVTYTKVSSEEKDEKVLKETLLAGVIENKGIKVKGKMVIPFYKLDGDSYLVTDYSSDMKFVYNEKSLCIFLKKTGDLVQMRRQTIIDTHLFFFP